MSKVIVQNPYNLETIEEIERTSEKDVFQSIEKAETIVKNRKWLPKTTRIEILEEFKKLVYKNKNELIEQAVKEGGKPLQDSIVEIERGIGGIDVAIDEIKHLAGHEIPMNITQSSKERLAFTSYRPRGIAVAISAFNHPFNLIIHQVIPAVAAGCPVLVKPASTTPLSCRSIVKLLHESGLDKDYCQMTFCSNDIAEKIISNKNTSFLTFIGSARIGWHLRSILAPGASCALEHGGVAPAIIDETADLKSCIPSLVKGGFYHAGQVCVSVQRIYVQKSIKEQFIEEFKVQVEKLKTGDSLKKETDVGPLIQPKELTRVEKWVNEAISQGAKCITGGKALSKTLYAPTVLTNVSSQSTIAQNEIFGPVVLIDEYEDLSEAISKANSLDVAFQASIFTQNLERALYASQELEGLSIMINDHTAFRVDWMPFGGYKNSGLGVGGIGHTIKDLSIEKMTVIKSQHLK